MDNPNRSHRTELSPRPSALPLVDGARLQRIAVEGRRFELFLPAQGVDELLDRMPDGPDPGPFPYWACVWPAAHGLARHLLCEAPLSGRAIELGCGLGLPGLAAAAAGMSVLETDAEPEALELVRRSAEASGLADRVACAPLDWDRPGEVGTFELVIGCEVCYEARFHAPLSALLPRLVAPGGRILLAHPGRKVTEEFVERMHERFLVTTLRSPLVVDGTEIPLAIHELVLR